MVRHTRPACSSATYGCAVVISGLLIATLPLVARAQTGPPDPQSYQVDGFALSLDSSISRLSVPPGGFVRISGTVTYSPDGTTIDAASEAGPGGNLEAGMIDPVASGLTLRRRDPGSHTYSYDVGDLSGATCSAAGLQAPCLVLRLPQIAADRLRDVGELRENLAGALAVQVHQPTAPAVAMPPQVPVNHHPFPNATYHEPADDSDWLWMGAAGTGAGLLLSLGALFLGVRRRRRGQGPAARVQASAARLRKKLVGDLVKARLLTVVNDLASEAQNLVALEKRLDKAVRDANPEELKLRRDQLLESASRLAEHGGEAAGQGEMDDAAKIVEGQIDRCRKWEMQRWRSAARLERIATRLEALEAELNDPAQEAAEPKQELLNVLQEELDLARAGEREAQKLLSGSSDDSGSGSGSAAA